MSILITMKTKVITQGFNAPVMPLGVVMKPPLSRHTVTRIMCGYLRHGG
jgi:hypothetical protein